MGVKKEEKERKAASGGFLVVSIVLISFCLRSPITVVGPQVSLITEELSVSGSLMGLVSTLPLLAFGLFSPFVGKIDRTLGTMKTVLFGLLAVSAGLVIRCSGGIAGLIVGTVLMGLGIAVENVMIPSMIRRWFPDRVSAMTSVYTTSMGTFAAIGAGVSVPVSFTLGWGWRGALGIWVVLAAAALIVWAIQMKKGISEGEQFPVLEVKTDKGGTEVRNVWKSATAWKITLFMGLQSFLFYSTSSWMPTIMQSHGVTVEGTGILALIFQTVSILGNVLSPLLAKMTKKQELVGSGIGALFLVGTCGLFFHVDSFALAALFFACGGLMSGASLSWILTLIGTIGRDTQETAEMSGMAQSVGYLLAAAGPLLSGFIFDMTGTWTATICFYLIGGAALSLFGFLAGKEKTLF